MQSRNVDIVVVGAGLAGLSAGYRLSDRGHSVLVLEASGRVGGRTVSDRTSSGDVVDGGGQWIGKTHRHVHRLARELGVATFPSPAGGDNLMVFEGRERRFRKLPPFGFGATLDCIQLLFRLDRLAATIPVGAPWTARNAAALDATSFGDWLARKSFTAAPRFLLRTVCRLNIGAEPEKVSLLYVLGKIRSAGGFKQLTALGLETRFVDGSQALSLRLAERLGGRLRLSSPVERIDYTDRSVRVRGDGFAVTAKRCLVAMDPRMSGAIAYEPALPATRAELCRSWTLKKGSKAHCLYERPFWRERGLSGNLVRDEGPVIATYDNGRPQSGHGALLVFADFSGTPLSAAKRKAATLDVLAASFGPPAREPIDYVEHDWSDNPWIGGCVSNPAPGVLTRGGPALRAPHGALRWASAETADLWEGHMEGAVRAGELAAEELAADLAQGGGA